MNMKKMILPNNLECYYLGNEETEYIFSEVFTEQQYFRHGIMLHEGDCIFDVGANIGLFALFVSQLQKQVKIFAFEPIKPIFKVLQANTLYLSRLGNAIITSLLTSRSNFRHGFCWHPCKGLT